MKSFISTDRDTILECLQGEKLLNIVPDGLGNVSLVFESANPDASDLLTVKPDGKIIATLLYDEEEAPSVKPCSVDILGISLGEEGLLIIPREVRMQCEPLVNAANALMNALNDLPVSTVDKNTIALLAADLMAQAEQEGVKNGVEAYTDFTHDMTPEKFTELVKSVKDGFHAVLIKTADKQKAAFPCANREGRQIAGQRIAVMFPALILSERRGIFNVLVTPLFNFLSWARSPWFVSSVPL